MGKQKAEGSGLVAELSDRVSRLRGELNDKFVEREEIIHGMLVALLARENLFLLGPAGTSKSALCNALCQAITGSRFFSWVLGKTTAPEELYGPISFKGLQEDRYVRNTTGKLPEAHIGFLDEIWKGSSALTNTLLPVINERVFFNGPDRIKIPLQVMFGASNEIPSGEESAAMWDRFALRYVTSLIQDDDNFKKILQGNALQTTVQLSLEELGTLQAHVAGIGMSGEAMEELCKVRRLISEKGIYVSDRKWVQSLNILRAQAFLSGHATVEVEDLEILQHVLWPEPKQITTVRKLVLSTVSPVGEQLASLHESILEIEAKLKKISKEKQTEFGLEANNNIKSLLAALGKMQKQHPSNGKLAATQVRLEDLNKKIAMQCFGFKA